MAAVDRMGVVLNGNLIQGFEVVGPFPDWESACAYDDQFLGGRGWVMHVEYPKKDLWGCDAVQFPRLLAEIMASCALTEEQWNDLAASMDLTDEQLRELFDRAQEAWERIKAETVPVR